MGMEDSQLHFKTVYNALEKMGSAIDSKKVDLDIDDRKYKKR